MFVYPFLFLGNIQNCIYCAFEQNLKIRHNQIQFSEEKFY